MCPSHPAYLALKQPDPNPLGGCYLRKEERPTSILGNGLRSFLGSLGETNPGPVDGNLRDVNVRFLLGRISIRVFPKWSGLPGEVVSPMLQQAFK